MITLETMLQVYETQARLALEFGDLFKYNQCQSHLQTLYVEGIEGSDMEFSAYNLLCVIMHSNNNRDLVSSIARLAPYLHVYLILFSKIIVRTELCHVIHNA
ncbi:hypothetical protein AAZV13_01G092600 [Glycine max]